MLYCWELQVEDEAQRKGIGRFMMQLLELIARRCAPQSRPSMRATCGFCLMRVARSALCIRDFPPHASQLCKAPLLGGHPLGPLTSN